MKKRLRVFLYGVCFAPCISQEATAQSATAANSGIVKEEPSFTPQTIVLRNGITVVLLEDHSIPSVAVRLVLRVSPAIETEDIAGTSHLLRAILGQGISDQPTVDAKEFASANGIVVGFSGASNSFEQKVASWAGQVMHPRLSDTAFEHIRANLQEKSTRAQQTPAQLARQLFANVIYGVEHPYTSAETIRPSAFSTITRETIDSLYTQYVCPPNVVFALAGDLTPEQVKSIFDRSFGDWNSGERATTRPSIPKGVPSTTVYLFDRPGWTKSTIMIGQTGFRRDTSEAAFKVAAKVLGMRLTSLLKSEAEDSVAFFVQYRGAAEVGTLGLTMQVPSAWATTAIDTVLAEIRDIRSKRPITTNELTAAQTLITSEDRTLSLDQRADRIAELLRDDLPLTYPMILRKRVTSVTLDQVRVALEKSIDPFALGIIVVGDRSTLEPKLRKTDIAPLVILEP